MKKEAAKLDKVQYADYHRAGQIFVLAAFGQGRRISSGPVIQNTVRAVPFILDLHLKGNSLAVYDHVYVQAAELFALAVRRYIGVSDFKLPDAVQRNGKEGGDKVLEQVGVLNKKHFKQGVGFEGVFQSGHAASLL